MIDFLKTTNFDYNLILISAEVTMENSRIEILNLNFIIGICFKNSHDSGIKLYDLHVESKIYNS